MSARSVAFAPSRKVGRRIDSAHGSSRLGQVRAPLGELHPQVGFDEAVDVAVEDGAGVADFVVGPQVLDDLVRLEHVRADLVAEADFALLVVLLGELGLALLFLQADELGLKQGQGIGVVLVLRALAARLGGDAGRQVGVADARLGLVLVLAAGTAASGTRRA